MTANPEPESSSIFPSKKPILADKPVPKPRRRLTIGGKDSGTGMIVAGGEIGQPKEVKLEEAETQRRKAPSPPPLARKAMAYRNGTAALLTPQMPKIETKNAQEDLMVKSGIEAAAKRPKPTMGEQRMEPRLRRSNTTLTGPLRPNKMGENVHPNMVNGASKRKAPITPPSTQQSTTRLRIPAPPPPLPVKRRIGEEATDGQSPKKDGQNGSKLLLGGKVDGKAQIGAHLQQQKHQKEQSPIPYLTPFCPTASPEATSSFSPSSTTTGSSLNSPSPPSPPSPHIFAKSWPSAEEGSSRNDQMLEELAKEGGAECRLIASWLSGNGGENGDNKNEEKENNGIENKEQQLERPRFSLDRLVPPELQESPSSSSNNSSIWADFTLRRPSVRGQCQGTVYVHWHQEKSRLDFSMENGGGQKGKVPPQSSVPKLANPMSSHSPSPRRQSVTLLEQLVKSHPIWFLPHLDRQAVGHLLRNQPAGVFIVRASSRSIQSTTQQPNTSPNHLNPPKKSRSSAGGPVMALSIRLPPTTQNDQQDDDHLEHFLLEAIGPGQSVRLEGSPNIFASLPLLLEHYSQLEALQELKCRLRLPEAIARSDSIQTLQGLALMGQDFWTSPLSTAPCPSGSAANSPEATIISHSSHSQCQSPTSSSLRSGPLPSLPPPPPQMSTFQLHHQFQHRPLQPNYCQSPSPSMATTVDGSGVAEDQFESAYHNHHQRHHPMMVQRGNGGGGCFCCCCAGCPTHHPPPPSHHLYQYQQFPPLRKSHSIQSSFTPTTANPSNGSSSNRHPWCQSPGSQSLRESRKLPQNKQKDGFLRSIFSPSPSRRKQSSSSDWMGPAGVESPLWEEPAEGQIWNGQKRRANNNKGGQNGQSQSIFARLKGKNNLFRRTNSSGMGIIKDDWATNSNMSPEMLLAKQAAFRRTNTDMGGCGMAAALGRMRAAAPIGNGPLPQLARVLPQPRREFPITMNGNSTLQGQIAAPPADIRKNNFQKSRWQKQSPQSSSDVPPIGLQRIQQRMTDSVGGGQQQNVATFRLSNGSQQGRSQAIVATVRPQQKMMPMPNMAKQSREEETEKLKDGGPSEYTHLNELKSEGEWESGRRSFGSKSGDELSLAGTDFNEPWDSNAWENLLDLARFGDTKAEIPLLTEQPKRRSCSTSSNGSTWRRSSQSSSTEAEDEDNLGQSPKGKIEEETSADEMAAATEEAMAMAMILAGNGTLPNSRKKPRTEEWGEGEENDPKLVEWKIWGLISDKNIAQSLARRTHQNPSMDTLILIEQAAKAANSSRGLQRGRWTRATSSSLIDMTKPPVDNGRMTLGRNNGPDRPLVEEDDMALATGSNNDYDPFNTCSMDQLNNHFKFKNPPTLMQHSTKTTTAFNRMDDENGHRRSERRIRAMMEKSIEEIASPTFRKTMNIPDTQNEANKKHEITGKCEEKMSSGIAQFNSTPTIHHHHHHHHQQNGAAACSSSMDELSHHSRSGSICPSITPILSPSRLRNAEHPGEEDPVNIIQRYVENLSVDDKTVFGATLQRFIECTLLSREQDPYVVIRRVRQFLNGIKNYLVGNGEGDLHALITRESDRLHPDEFLNIDAILEAVLNKILLVRIKSQLYRLMLLESTRNGELGKLSENLTTVRAMNSTDLGFPEGTPMPDTIRMEQISKQMRKMQNHYSPLKKLQLLLRALALAVPHLSLLSSSELRHQQAQQSNSSILVSSQSFSDPRFRTNSGSSSNGTAMAAALKHPPADELIRWLVYLLARCSTINCEIEAWYMWELLPQQVLSTGDAAYFLSILFSAVYVLKHPENIRRLKNISLQANHHLLPNIADFLGSQSTLHEQEETSSDLLLRVAIPNEQEGSIEYHTFPVLPQMNAAKLCRIIAHQFSVSNPEDYGLYLIVEGGHETSLNPNELPHLIRDQMLHSVKHHLFVYKRSGARIAWRPKFTNSHTPTITAAAYIPHQQQHLAML